jgi:hypothetical protein
VLENRPRFGFALSATIPNIAGRRRRPDHLNLAEPVSKYAAGACRTRGWSNPRRRFRQLFPLFISTRNPEATLLFLLPIIRPFFPVMALFPIPFKVSSTARGATKTR